MKEMNNIPTTKKIARTVNQNKDPKKSSDGYASVLCQIKKNLK